MRKVPTFQCGKAGWKFLHSQEISTGPVAPWPAFSQVWAVQHCIWAGKHCIWTAQRCFPQETNKNSLIACYKWLSHPQLRTALIQLVYCQSKHLGFDGRQKFGPYFDSVSNLWVMGLRLACLQAKPANCTDCGSLFERDLVTPLKYKGPCRRGALKL